MRRRQGAGRGRVDLDLHGDMADAEAVFERMGR